jgi:hypothetical protein
MTSYYATIPQGKQHIVFLTTVGAKIGEPKDVVATFVSFKAAMEDCGARNLAALQARA